MSRRYIGGFSEGECVFMCRGVWIPQGTRLSNGCVGCVVGGVIVVEAFGTACAALVGSSSEGIVSYLLGACCCPYAGLGWRCGAMAARRFCGRHSFCLYGHATQWRVCVRLWSMGRVVCRGFGLCYGDSGPVRVGGARRVQ